MAICNICGREMLSAVGCIKLPITHEGKKYNPIKCGEPGDFYFGDGDRNSRCGDCGALPGRYHHDGCDCERCPICGDQLISCGCDDRCYIFHNTENPSATKEDLAKVVRKNLKWLKYTDKTQKDKGSLWFRFLVSKGFTDTYAIYQVVKVMKTTCVLERVNISEDSNIREAFPDFPIVYWEEQKQRRAKISSVQKALSEQDAGPDIWDTLMAVVAQYEKA